MLAPWRNSWSTVDPALRGLLGSDVLTSLAEMVGYVALPWWIAQHGGARDLATYGVVLAVATFAAFALFSPLGERIAKRTQLARGLPLLALPACAFAALASAECYDIRLVLAIALLRVAPHVLVHAASAAITPELVPAERLPDALRARKTGSSIGRLLGPLLGGGVLSATNSATALWLSGVLLAAASLAAWGIPASTSAPPTARRFSTTQWWRDLRDGAVAKWSVPLERGWTLVNFGVWIFVGPAVVMLVPLKVQALGLSGAWLGACEASLSVGMLLGSLKLADALVQRFGRYAVRVGAAVTEGLALAFIGFTSTPTLLVLGFACVGIANTAMALVGATHRALAVPQEFRVRMGSINVMSTQVANALGPALAGMALLHWPLNTVYTAFGMAAAGLASSFLLIPRSKEFFSLDHAEVKDWYRLHYPEAFPTPAGDRQGSRST